VADLCALTVAEARAILIADEALVLSFAAREECGRTFGVEELDAWRRLVESATARIAAYERPVVVSTPYPGGNEPDGQTLLLEAAAASEQQREIFWRMSTVSTKSLLHAFLVGATWSLCGLAQLVNTARFARPLQDRCKSCARFARTYEHSEGAS
jgi:hypothetical protein